jgi:hypothetical protein
VKGVGVVAVCQLGLIVTGMASSRAGSLPQFGFGWSRILCMAWISVGAAVRRFDLLAKAVCQLHHCWMLCRLRGQARSHRDCVDD